MKLEMRWLDAPLMVSEAPLPDGFHMTIPRQKILQFRLFPPNGLPVGVDPNIWFDVPTVIYEQLRDDGDQQP